jgi:hypothetical protein
MRLVTPLDRYSRSCIEGVMDSTRVRRMSRYYSAESIGGMMVHTTHNAPQMTRVATGLQKAIPTATM